MAFQKLGRDRMNQNVARAVNTAGTRLTTGQINAGDVVTVTFNNSDSESVEVAARRTGAIPLSQPFDKRVRWSISGERLTVTLDSSDTGNITFWVF